MSTQVITFMEEKQITVWMPDGATDAEKAALATDHISRATMFGLKSKLMSIEPWFAAPDQQAPGNVGTFTPKRQK